AFGLCDGRLDRKNIQVIWRDVENLIQLLQSFRETTQIQIGKRVLGEKVNVARVEPLGFVEIGLTSLPLAPPSLEIGQRFRNLAAVGQKRTGLLKLTHCCVVIL